MRSKFDTSRIKFFAPTVLFLYLFSFTNTFAEQLQQEAVDLEEKADSLYCEGKILFEHYRFEDAIDKFKQTLEIYRKLARLNKVGSELAHIGDIYYDLSQYDKALAYYDSSLAIAREISDRKLKGRTLNSVGEVYYYLSQYDKALAYFDSALVTERQIKDKYGEGITISNIGATYDDLSQYDKALAYYDSSLSIARNIEDREGQGYTFNNIGVVYNVLGYYDKALAYYDSALVIAREIKNRQLKKHILNNIGTVYHFLNQYDKALAYYDSSLVIAQEIKDRYGTGLSFSNMGGICCVLGHHDKALAYYDSALVIARGIKNKHGEGVILCNVGQAYHALTRYDKALAYFDSALIIMKKIRDRRAEGSTLNNIGTVYDALGYYDKALAYYDSALVINRDIRNRRGEGITLNSIGGLYDKMADVEKAVSFYKQSVDIKESIRKGLQFERIRSSYVEAEKDVYEQLIILLIMLEQYEEAFDYMERSHSEKVRRSFEMGDITAYDPSLRRALERINFIAVEMEGLKKRYVKNELEEEAFNTNMKELEGKLNQRFFDLKTYHPQLYNIMEPQRRTLEYIQQTIPENTIFLEFILAGDNYVVLLFTNSIFLGRSIVPKREKIDSLVINALTSVVCQMEIEKLNEYYVELYNMLIKPIENEIEEYENIVIIPYGTLHYLPFHALRRETENKESEYFVEYKRVSYLPSASFLLDITKEKKLAEKNLLAFGNADGSLPNAEVEVDLIAKIFPHSLVFKTEKATKERFIRLCSEYRLLHLATHGVLHTDPRFSYIVLAPGEEGNLTVREILGLSGYFKLTSLVTLSACKTAVEKTPETAGMELITLSNAFKVAGVPSIIATLWEIADRSTAFLMKDFYQNLKKENIDKLAALRQTQISMIKHSKYGHPYYWAPFILIGNWR